MKLIHFCRNLNRYMSADKALRWSLGIVYLWFGILKAINMSPATALIQQFYAPMTSIPLYCLLTLFEIVVGALFLADWRTNWAALAAMGHLIGTFGILVVAPEIAFKPFFPILSMEGEFVIKNVALFAAAYAIFVLVSEQECEKKQNI